VIYLSLRQPYINAQNAQKHKLFLTLSSDNICLDLIIFCGRSMQVPIRYDKLNILTIIE